MNGRGNRRLWAVCGELGIDSETLHARAEQEFGTRSISELSDVQRRQLAYILQGRAPARRRPAASEKQIWLIHKIEQELGWAETPERLAGFLRKYAGVESVEWLTCRSASAVIEGLKGLQKRERAEND